MAVLLEFVAGTVVSCADGSCGTLARLIIDPTTRTLTHLVVLAKGIGGEARLVDIGQVQSTTNGVQLRCRRDEFDLLDPNDAAYLMPVGGSGISSARPLLVTLHRVPDGEVEVNRNQNVVALDGTAGHLRALAVDADGFRVQQLRVAIGHFRRRHEVVIPAEVVTSFDAEGPRLSISKAQVAAF